jgi:hypothetical protein
MVESLQVVAYGRALRVRVPEGVSHLRVSSDRNASIPTLIDRSPFAPKRQSKPGTASTILDEMLYFPVVDIRLAAAYRGRLVFEGEGTGRTTYSVNGHFNDVESPTAATVIVPADRLEHWENGVFVGGSDCRVAGFAIEAAVEAGKEHTLDLLSDDWSGTIEAVDRSGAVIARCKASLPPSTHSRPPAPPVQERDRLDHALRATLGYILRSINGRPSSPTANGMFLFYDHDARTFRTSHWNWTWGPAIRLLLDGSRLGERVTGVSPDQLVDAALSMGQASLSFQIDDRKHPADGFMTVRWSPGLRNRRETGYLSPSSPDFPVDGWAPSHPGERFVRGFEAYVSPADALFLAGWGWMPLYQRLGAGAFIEATGRMIQATRALLETYEIVPQDMPLAEGKWTDYTREEAGFGMIGLSEYARHTGRPDDVSLARRYMDQITDKLERPDGLWNRHYWRTDGRTTGCEYKSRSLGWATMGLLWAHDLSPEAGYLDKVVAMAEHFLQFQHAPGYWGLVINKPIGETEVSVKGTSIWSMLLYRIYERTGEDRYLSAARKALAWLVEQQYLGDDPDGYGGLVSCSAFSGVDYRRWFRLSCGYSSSFFGLALLAERAIREQER